MQRGCLAAAVAVTSTCVAVPGAVAKPRAADRLDVYTAEVSAEKLTGPRGARHRYRGEPERCRARAQVQLILTRDQRASSPPRASRASSRASRAARQSSSSPPPGRERIQGLALLGRAGRHPRPDVRDGARSNPQLTKLVKLGHDVKGREILALKVTQGARGVPDGSRPAVLYSSTQHAREWIATEVNRRLMNRYVDRWRDNDKPIKNLLKTTELWFVLVCEPGRLPVHVRHERLWRKNLRDNNGDGETTIGDGVDPNRNYPEHFELRQGGLVGDLLERDLPRPGGGLRGGDPRAEGPARPDRLRVPGQLPLGSGSGCSTRRAGRSTRRRPTTRSTSRCRATSTSPAIPGFHPGLSSDVLYVTNGETTDYAQPRGALAWTPELSEGCPGCGFVFPDDEALVQAEFEKNLPFARVGRQLGGRPRRSEVLTRDQDQAVLPRERRPVQGRHPGRELRVQVLLRRSAGGAGARQARRSAP